MKLGFFTTCLRGVSLEEIVKFASKVGFQALELAAWPMKSDRDYFASTIDVNSLDTTKAAEIKKLFKDHDVVISSLGYYENNISDNLEERKNFHEHLKKVIDAANLLEVGLVGTFVGRKGNASVAESLEEFANVFGELVAYAKKQGVSLMIENCPMPGWGQDDPNRPGQIAYSPEIWDKMFELIPDENFGLNYDPSHLYWMGIDPYEYVTKFKDRIFHAHAKDTEILNGKLSYYGIYGTQLGERRHGGGWWRYRLPGFGEIDWSLFIRTLYDIGYDGVLSIEHEDPVFEGSRELVERGLILGYKHLSQFIV
ncbi:MAG TPA: sugar phosphate isomerase/epimerase [Thermotogaceae bacterium]|nr:sugar phosphate isomerase/epimerase [Thermotogaceae bacterium]